MSWNAAGIPFAVKPQGTDREGSPSKLIGRVQRAQDDLHQLYEEVREYAAPVTIGAELRSLDQCLHEAWNHLAHKREGRTCRMREESDGVDKTCEFDPFAMRQVFRNILENSLDACRDPVGISLTYAAAELDGHPAVSIVLRDNGPGLSTEQQVGVFEEFYTTKTHGTGLGMAIARRFVEAHSGRIEARSAPDGGAEILITLPRKQP